MDKWQLCKALGTSCSSCLGPQNVLAAKER